MVPPVNHVSNAAGCVEGAVEPARNADVRAMTNRALRRPGILRIPAL
jgi:hypothetical protein